VELRLEETQQLLLRRLECDGVLEREVAELFHGLRRKGNLATHDLHGDHATALKILRVAWQLGVWFHRTFGDPQPPSGPFQPPQPPSAGDPELAEELQRLREALAAFQSAEGDDWQLVREQLIAKLRRKQRHLSENAEARFRLLSGEEPDAFIKRMHQLPETEARAWLSRIEGLGELLDAQWEVRAEPRFLSDHDDELLSIERGYGEAKRPEDYLEGFSAFVRDPGNDLPALTLVLTRPWELSRRDLRELRLALDQRG
jgi:hypothetical protein